MGIRSEKKLATRVLYSAVKSSRYMYVTQSTALFDFRNTNTKVVVRDFKKVDVDFT